MSGTSRQQQLKADLKHLQATEDIIQEAFESLPSDSRLFK